ncbi:MAG: hypothetical protein K5649_06010 [Lachnospiraceae bacterium]|nr:hypothetical protein [Lachnospiraceae bacterium]
MDATAFLVCLYNNSRVYREYGSDGIFRFATMILARDAELLDQLTYARSDEEELVHALLYYELKFGSKDALEKRKLYRDMTDREVENPIIPEDYVLGFDDGKVSATSYFGERYFDRFLTATGYITCTRSGGAFEYERALLNLDTLTEEGVSVSMEFEPTVYSIARKDVSEAEATQYVIDKVGDGFSFDDEIPAVDGVAFDQLYWSDDIADAIENAYVIKTDR